MNITTKELKEVLVEIEKNSKSILEKTNTNADRLSIHDGVLGQLIEDVKRQGEVLDAIIQKLQ